MPLTPGMVCAEGMGQPPKSQRSGNGEEVLQSAFSPVVQERQAL
jgi:hypothetical protein